MAILLGFDSIRIGMEDAVYMYPHRDDKIMRCADVVRAVATIARSLGREIATPAEARAIMGLPQIGASAKAPVKAPAAG
jgi:3-keto-5-aminohexanoate cleavage enzyme